MVAHEAYLLGLGGAGLKAPPLLAARIDENFVDGTMRDASTVDLTALLATQTKTYTDKAPQTLKLYQPLHRVFYLAMTQAVCDVPGRPRLDPSKIESAGLVVRRVARSRNVFAPQGEAWMTLNGKPAGWVPIASAAAQIADPDPTLRPVADQGNPAVNAAIQVQLAKSGVFEEDVVTMHVAPDEVCVGSGRTILFGLIPTMSAETGDLPVNSAPYAATDVAIPAPLRAINTAIDQLAGKTFAYADVATSLAMTTQELEPTPDHPDPEAALSTDKAGDAQAKQMHVFVGMLKTLTIQLDAFGDSPQSKAISAALKPLSLTFPNGTTSNAATFLATAATVLVLQPPIKGETPPTVTMPNKWPTPTPGQANTIAKAMLDGFNARFAAFVPRATRFDDPNARFEVRCFMRVLRDDGCPPELVWCEPSPCYAIAAWYDTADTTPPALVRLPNLSRDSVKKLKPNIAFSVPPNLFNLLNCNSPDDLMKGNGKPCDGGDGLGWICGFNIPIITLCAFIVLNIFLSLFNIIFFWLPFLKICFPVPASLAELGNGD
ncbi:MAG TPA: hypothetical protein VGM88_15185 [Kofleriaceae bacterium]|jgi:hypothetical protein